MSALCRDSIAVPATLVRGGTSKCWLFDLADLSGISGRQAGVDEVLAAAFGARDSDQIDGVGGATSTTSKAAIIGPATAPGIHVDYTFGQVGIGDERVEWGSNCGNCATAVGLHAVRSGLVPATAGRTRVRMRNTNTGGRIDAVVATPDGRVPAHGDTLVPGVTSPGVRVELEFLDPVGGTTGTLLPSGNPVDELARGEATLVDAGAPAALLDAATVGLTGVESVAEFTTLLPGLLPLRRAAAIRMRLAGPGDPVEAAVPKLGIVGPPRDYRTSGGVLVRAAEYDLAVRMVSMHTPHPAIGLTSMVAVLAAATQPGSVVRRHLGAAGGPVRLGTPAGVVTGTPVLDGDGRLVAVNLVRSARVIAAATIFVPRGAGVGAA
ncbi:PrpF domain-containing protein [Amycolatopsis aidingensis]|uniref:PrpF domain-containing protein n=1 Tax=Amycolatopsis aidingensis TaxID=2842453 RepID=UPI001C0B7DAF|nr:PrpF domain-containing protein [Amycolatopsis aidingensis]